MKLGIIGAMDMETDLLISKMNNHETRVVAGVTYYSGTLKDKQVVLATSGVGKVNAAVCAQILISEFKVTAIINTGVSGAIHHILEVGDIVISTDCMQHDFDCTIFGYAHGVIPRLSDSVFKADEKLIQIAYEASRSVIKSHNVYKGRIVSGDQFVASMDKKEFIEKNFNAYTTEMEGASIAHVCYLNDIPFVVIRAMSDKADGSAQVSFDDFAKEAALNSSEIVLDMLTEIND